MSGGERRRVALAALLVRATRPAGPRRADQPPRHRRHRLAGRAPAAAARGALVVVTHDRWFLDAVCDRTWEVADETVRAYEGGYAAWVLARAERARVAAAVEARRQNLLRKEIAWLRRGPPARTSKPKFRIDAANALIADVPEPRDTVSLRRLATARLGKQVLRARATSRCHGRARADPARRRDLAGRAGRPDRRCSAPTGPARSTLLRLLAGVSCRPTAGRLVTGRDGHGRRSCPRSCAELPDEPAGARGGGGGGPAGRAGRPGALGRPAGRGVRVHRPAAVDPGRRPVRRRAAPAAAAAAAGRRAQRAAARRADQRPRHRHPGRAGGPARHAGRAR